MSSSHVAMEKHLHLPGDFMEPYNEVQTQPLSRDEDDASIGPRHGLLKTPTFPNNNGHEPDGSQSQTQSTAHDLDPTSFASLSNHSSTTSTIQPVQDIPQASEDTDINPKANLDSQALSLDIVHHPQDDLILMLSSLLGKITSSNDNLHSNAQHGSVPQAGSPLLAFHARNIPSISIQAYLSRILKYCPMSSDIFLSLLVYFDRMSRVTGSKQTLDSQDTFTSTKMIIGEEIYPFSIDSFNVHRLVITGIVVASKFCSDVFYTNLRYAKVGGLPLTELNHLEFQFLLMNDFRLMIPVQELQRYGDQLLSFWLNERNSRSN